VWNSFPFPPTIFHIQRMLVAVIKALNKKEGPYFSHPSLKSVRGPVVAFKTLSSRDAAVERPWMGLPRVLNVTTGPRLKGLKFCVLR